MFGSRFAAKVDILALQHSDVLRSAAGV